MPMHGPFHRDALRLRPVVERGHDLVAEACAALERPVARYEHPDFAPFVRALRDARAIGRPAIWMMGAHPIKLGLSRYVIDLIERGLITHVAMNGAGLVHDFELTCSGGTSEDVARWIQVGQFGLWQETSRLNDVINRAARANEGLGAGVGRFLEESTPSYRKLSVLAACWRLQVPCTIHVTIGADVIHAHPNCSGAAWGASSYRDFLVLARTVQRLEGGVFVNLGTAVTGPEVFLKALSMARNVARQSADTVSRFTTAVFDLPTLPDNFREHVPGRNAAEYYWRPWKTLLVRTVAGGGQSYYFQGDHRQTVPAIWDALVNEVS